MLAFRAGTGNVLLKDVEYRFALVRNNLRPALAVVCEIRTAAERGDMDGVLAALNTKLEFGHDFSST